MKKTAIFLAVVLAFSMLVLSSCDLLAQIPGVGDLINKPCTEHVDANGDYICDNCQAELEKNDTPDTPYEPDTPDEPGKPEEKPSACEHADADKDHKCDSCGDTLSECVAANGSHNCSVCDKLLTAGTEIPATGHKNTEVKNAKAATCTEAGYTGDTYCADCGEKLEDGKTIEATGNETIMRLSGRFQVAKVEINGVTKTAMFDNKIDITGTSNNNLHSE